MKRPDRPACLKMSIRGACLLQPQIGRDVSKAVKPGIKRLDARQYMTHDINRRHGALPDQPGNLHERQMVKVRVAHYWACPRNVKAMALNSSGHSVCKW